MNFKTSTAYAVERTSVLPVATTVTCMDKEIIIEMVPGARVTPKAESFIWWPGAGGEGEGGNVNRGET